MADQVDTYDPKDIILEVAGNIITGYAQDTFIVVEREANQVEDEAGAEGDVARRMTNDKRGTITVTLLQTARANLAFTALAKADELTGDGIFPITIKDNRGNDLHYAPNSWIQKMPRTVYRAGIEGREWIFRTSNLQMAVGGAS